MATESKKKSNQKKITVMQIIPALESGGVERGVIDIAKSLKDNGFTALVVSGGGAMTYQLREAGIEHIKLAVNSKNPLTIYKNIGKIAALIKEYQVDIVHVRSRAPAWSAYYACKKTGCKLVSTFHGSYSLCLFGKSKSSLKMLYNSIMLKADKIIAVSNFIKNHIQENYSKYLENSTSKLTVIHRGADLDYFSVSKVSKERIIALSKIWDLPDDKNIIMLPGRITAWKGHEFLIDALSKVKNTDFLCLIVGSKKGHELYEKRLITRIESNNLAGKVRIVDAVKDMPAAYMLCDLVISASIRPEAFGRIAIEAGAMSKIAIATNIGGSLETIINNKTGFLVESENIQDLADKIDYALTLNTAKKEQIAQNAQNHIALNFSNKKMCEQTIKLYKQVLK